ncbi:MAG: DUF177 domain-containing protein [Gemmatimonadales bacterium]|nr:MAG: DUF177 domain-containing protein [Gemmatimonadales bacterium]
MDKGLPVILIPSPRKGKSSVAWAGIIPLEKEWVGGEVEFADQPAAEVQATESGNGGIHVTGKVSATLRVRCRRCLVRQAVRMESAIDIRFEPDIDAWDEAPGLYQLDDRLEMLDLLPALREELLLALPSYPVCRPECKGLCAVCGMDLNASTCECRIEITDSRWEALRNVSEGRAQENDDDEIQEG